MRPLVLPLLVAVLAIVAPPASAQSGRLAGVSIERFYSEDYRFVTVNYRRTDLRERDAKTGMDLAVGFAPIALRANTAVLQVDAGFASALPVGPGTLLLRGGMSNFLAVGQETGFVSGFHGGLAVIVPLQKQARVRLDVTRHFYVGFGDGPVAMWSIGLGLAAISP